MKSATTDPFPARVFIIGITLAFIALLLVFPVAIIVIEAFDKGFPIFWSAVTSVYSWTAIRLTLLTALVVVPLNTVFGICIAWAVTHFHFRGKTLLISLVEIPLWVSPVIGGVVFALIFGQQGWFGPWLDTHHIQILFAFPGIVLATAFVTSPFVARGLIPLMQSQGSAEEEAALTLGANGWQLFWRVSFPKIKWGVLYGMILCNARAMGEFGAVSVVAGNVDNGTNTIPLQIYQYYLGLGSGLSKAFALSSLLLVIAVLTLVFKSVLEWRWLPQDRMRRS